MRLISGTRLCSSPLSFLLVLGAVIAIIAPVGDAFSQQQRTTDTSTIRRTQSLWPPSSTFLERLKDDPYKVATLLLGTLLERQKMESDSSLITALRKLTPDYKTSQEQQQRTIEECITILSSRRDNSYDPSTCLLGGFYCTLFTYNPSNPEQKPPLWEQISLLAANLKGQQYYLNRNFQLSVINYAEVWGSSAAIRAQAFFAPAGGAEEFFRSSSSEEKSILPSFLAGIVSTNTQSDKDPVLRSCPDVFDIQLVKAELSFDNGKTLLPVPIEGSAQFAVLYADPRIRILLSPTGSESTVGPWEQAGLVAVQVRSDLVTEDSTPLDLR